MAQRIGALRLWNRFLSTSASTASCTPSVAAGSSAEIGVQEFLKSVGKGVEAHAEKVANESGSFSDFLQLRSGRLKLDEEEFDEDVFMEELLLKEEEAQDTGVEAIRTRLAKWKRPNVQRYHNAYDSIVFQQLEIDYIIEESNKDLLPDTRGPAAVLRIFGVTEEGNSVCCHVHGFQPYFYIMALDNMGVDDIPKLRQTLENRMRDSSKNKAPVCVTDIKMVQKRSIMYYQTQKP